VYVCVCAGSGVNNMRRERQRERGMEGPSGGRVTSNQQSVCLSSSSSESFDPVNMVVTNGVSYQNTHPQQTNKTKRKDSRLNPPPLLPPSLPCFLTCPPAAERHSSGTNLSTRGRRGRRPGSFRRSTCLVGFALFSSSCRVVCGFVVVVVCVWCGVVWCGVHRWGGGWWM
jgi:hypothetical protein